MEEKSLEEIRAEMQGGMAYYVDPPKPLPIRQVPLNFAVIRKNGLSSNTSKIRRGSNGDIYIICRDAFDRFKVSLHRNGKCYMSFGSDLHTGGNRQMKRWEVPLPDLNLSQNSEIIPSFRFAFPSSALWLNQEKRDRQAKIWDKPHVFVESPESPFGTVVSFFLIDETAKNLKGKKSLGYPLVVTSAWPGRILWVLVNHEYEYGMLRAAGKIISQMGENLNEDAVEKIMAMPDGKVLTVTVSSRAADGSMYFMPFPIEIQRDS